MKWAIIPAGKVYLHNEIFNLDNIELNRDNGLKFFIDLRDYLINKNIEINTIDMYSEPYNDIDFFIFFTFDYKWYSKIANYHREKDSIYVALEPAVVDNKHSHRGLRKLLKFFKCVLSWNDDAVDNDRIFKIHFPYHFEKDCSGKNFSDKKLLVNISGNKMSRHPSELYSERYRVIRFLENHEGFELYGSNWETLNLKCYKGKAKNKKEIYHDFKFALCFENMKDVNGYITEKILDCLSYGIVPVYWGASNISEYIPPACYIDYRQFETMEDMLRKLEGMTEEEYNRFMRSVHDFLDRTNLADFSAAQFARVLIKCESLPSILPNKIKIGGSARLIWLRWSDKVKNKAANLVSLKGN